MMNIANVFHSKATHRGSLRRRPPWLAVADRLPGAASSFADEAGR